MARITIAGHSVHAILNDWPIALFSTAFVFDALSFASGNRSLARAGYYSLIAGWVTGVGAAATGIAEYRAIEKTGPVRRLANRHGLINVAVMGIATTTLGFRRRSPETVNAVPLIASSVANALTFLSAWLGDEMVYGHQVRVQDRYIRDDDRDIRPPGDESVTRGLRRIGTNDPRLAASLP